MTDDASGADDGEEYEDGPIEAPAPGLAVTALAGVGSLRGSLTTRSLERS